MSQVENDDGTCPECGAPLMGSLIFDATDGGDPYEASTPDDVED